MARRKNNIFAPYRQSRFAGRGIAALVMSLISLAVLVAVVGWSMVTEGGAMMVAGALGLAGVLLSFAGVTAGLRSLGDDAKSHLPDRTAILLGAVLTVIWFLIICLGLA